MRRPPETRRTPPGSRARALQPELVALLRPALELAMGVVREGRRATPPVEPPRPLRPLLRFTRLPDRALVTVAEVLDGDAGLRATVAASAGAEEQRIGAAGVLFLSRPEGWDEDLAALVTAATDAAAAIHGEAADRAASRRVVALESDVARLTNERDRYRSEAGSAGEALAEERLARRAADDARANLDDRVRRLEQERDAAHRKTAAADRDAAAVRAELREVRKERERAEADDTRRRVADALPVIRDAIRVAVDASAAVRDALDQALRALDDTTASGTSSRASKAVGRRPRRTPVPVPPGLFADSPEVAEHLVRVRSAMLVVDGYNASLHAWPGLELAEQRTRLVDALDELAARSGVEVVVVFDGTGDAATQVPLSPRRGVAVRFTSVAVEADETIVDIAEDTPADRPVIVATDDQRVRSEAAAAGANLLTRAQLFGVLRRDIGR